MGKFFVLKLGLVVLILEGVTARDYLKKSPHRRTRAVTGGKRIARDVHKSDDINPYNLSNMNITVAENILNLRQINARNQENHLKEIPSTFQVKGQNAMAVFEKYINDISDLARKDNLTIIYDVKVRDANKGKRKRIHRKIKAKKYNVPLKKKNMKLSNFERIMRKLAETNNIQVEVDNSVITTEGGRDKMKSTTYKIPVMKYKPVIRPRKMNYTRIVKPVKNAIITLKS